VGGFQISLEKTTKLDKKVGWVSKSHVKLLNLTKSQLHQVGWMGSKSQGEVSKSHLKKTL
jgi:hypothetical protein